MGRSPKELWPRITESERSVRKEIAAFVRLTRRLLRAKGQRCKDATGGLVIEYHDDKWSVFYMRAFSHLTVQAVDYSKIDASGKKRSQEFLIRDGRVIIANDYQPIADHFRKLIVLDELVTP